MGIQQGAQGRPQVLPSGLNGTLEGVSVVARDVSHPHSFWRLELRAVWKEMLRSWDISCLRSRVSLVLLLTTWGIFHVLFQPVLESGYMLLVMYF